MEKGRERGREGGEREGRRKGKRQREGRGLEESMEKEWKDGGMEG